MISRDEGLSRTCTCAEHRYGEQVRAPLILPIALKSCLSSHGKILQPAIERAFADPIFVANLRRRFLAIHHQADHRAFKFPAICSLTAYGTPPIHGRTPFFFTPPGQRMKSYPSFGTFSGLQRPDHDDIACCGCKPLMVGRPGNGKYRMRLPPCHEPWCLPLDHPPDRELPIVSAGGKILPIWRPGDCSDRAGMRAKSEWYIDTKRMPARSEQSPGLQMGSI